MAETAISLIVTFTLAFFFFESSMLVYSYVVMNNAAREGVRYAVVHGSDSSNCSGPSTGCTDTTGNNVVTVVKSYAATCLHDISGMGVVVNWPDPTKSDPMSLVTVSITYNFIPYFKFPGFSNTLRLTSEGRIVF